MMRLSDAINLGRVLINFTPDFWMSSDGTCGCAIGMAAASIGKRIDDMADLFEDFPILAHRLHPPKQFWAHSKSIECWFIISRMAVAISRNEYTCEQLIDWVRQIEPVDQEEELRDNVPCENSNAKADS